VKRLILLSMIVPLIGATPAAGKSLQDVEVCGESECESVPSRELHGHQAFDWVFGGGSGTGGEKLPAGAAVWRVSVTVGAGTDGNESEALRQMVAPRAGYIRLDDAIGPSHGAPRWERMSSTAAPKWVELTRGIAPLERPKPDRGGDADAPTPGPSTAGAGDDSPAWPLALAGGLGLVAALALWRRRSG
jgi:hypothetical protein